MEVVVDWLTSKVVAGCRKKLISQLRLRSVPLCIWRAASALRFSFSLAYVSRKLISSLTPVSCTMSSRALALHHRVRLGPTSACNSKRCLPACCSSNGSFVIKKRLFVSAPPAPRPGTRMVCGRFSVTPLPSPKPNRRRGYLPPWGGVSVPKNSTRAPGCAPLLKNARSTCKINFLLKE